MSDRAIGFEGAYNTAIGEISRLRAEVERLKARAITAEQIDKAWAMATGNQPEGIWVMEELGIVECYPCAGTGVHLCGGGGNGFRQEPCHFCHGHKWIRVQPAHLEQANGTQEVK
jgi:hypothetical protein